MSFLHETNRPKNGQKKIEEIEVGDEVLAYDEETGEQAYKPVVRLFRNETDTWYHIHVNGEEIKCTAEHPFYVADFGKFIPARELTNGMKLLLSDGKCVTIERVDTEKLDVPETTYNFEVADFHTYYVTESCVLTHNKCPVGKMNREIKKGRAPKEVEQIHDTEPSVPNSKVHAHFSDGTALNIDGTTHDAKRGIPSISRKTRIWVEKYGWIIPKKFWR